ncbi:hypothetical protein ExPCM14_00106 [Escherichia coli]|nr:hypothetical protein ExPCM14_00106 [Escherichia coli]
MSNADSSLSPGTEELIPLKWSLKKYRELKTLMDESS